MRQPKATPNDSSDGFEGSIAGLALPDVLELSAQNRFSGCISVYCDISSGLLFFRDGELVNAELDGKTGEEAFLEIVRWPTGTFRLQPNVATTRQTIQRSWRFLLMEVHRMADEARAGLTPRPTPPDPAEAAKAEGSTRTVDRIQQVPGVTRSVILTKHGERLGDDGYEAEKLAGEAAYLTLVSRRLGEIFGAGPIVAAMVQGTHQHLLHLTSKQHDLSVLVEGSAQPGLVEAEIRKLLAPKR